MALNEHNLFYKSEICTLIQGNSLEVLKNIKPNPTINAIIPIIQQQYKTNKIISQFNENLPEIITDRDKFQQIIISCEIVPTNKRHRFCMSKVSHH